MDAECAFIPGCLHLLPAFFRKAHAKIAHTQTFFSALIFQRFNTSRASIGRPVNGYQNLQSGRWRDSANVRFGLFRKTIRFTRRPYLLEFDPS
jgi:hypothetical protein